MQDSNYNSSGRHSRGRSRRRRGNDNSSHNRRDSGRGHDRGRRHSRDGGRNRRGQRHSHHRHGFDNGNQRERIAVESGVVVLIDQFMLANPQFIEKLNELLDEAPAKKDDLIRHFGGEVVTLEPGIYRIERDPYRSSIVIHQNGKVPDKDELTEQTPESLGAVFVDTRCLAMIDRELLDDVALIEKYRQLWFEDQSKACRDLLRDNGGAVRYGFSRFSDDLEVYHDAEKNIILLSQRESNLAESKTDSETLSAPEREETAERVEA